MKISQSVSTFLKAQPSDLGNLYTPDMEVQVLAAQDGGTLVEMETNAGRRFRRWTDGIQEWGPLRIPRNAGTTPEDNDFEMRWDLAEHAEGIGLTGWDWRNKMSRYVAFDFDSISGHVRAGQTDAALNEVRNQACQLPWVTVRKSTSGKGIHLYVFFGSLENGVWTGGVATENHHEHAALARSILGKMSALANFDFGAKLDVCGGNMWVYHRKNKGTDGFALLKQGEVLTEVPANWRDHLTVVRGERKRIRAQNMPDDKEDAYEQITGTHIRVPLNEEHKKVISGLEAIKALHWWDADRHLLVAHTHDLKTVHENLGLRGLFFTSATGKLKGNDQNCFLFPMSNGGWVVRRHTPGIAEHPLWEQDGSGWTRCYYNTLPDLAISARAYEGLEHPKGGFVFHDGASAIQALQQLGINVDLPNPLLERPQAVIKETRDGRLVFELPRENHDTNINMKGWIAEAKRWVRVFASPSKMVEESDVNVLATSDKYVRHLVDEQNQDGGWVLRGTNGAWQHEVLTHVKAALESLGMQRSDVVQTIGTNVLHAWKIVNLPFQPEYPGNRQWNKDAAQLRFIPSPNNENLKFDHWRKILNHCGADLDRAVKCSSWCVSNGILTGGDYLLYWVASLFQNPDQPLPYLFLWSREQDTGKSMFHESLRLLMTHGYESAENALTNENGFNGELASAVLCYVEEKNISKSKVAYSRIKNWVTARTLAIHPKGGTPYLTRNCTHWVHCANEVDACPQIPGDTRITVIQVSPLDLTEMIPKMELESRLEREAPDFLRYLLDLEIPKAESRLAIPMLATESKLAMAERNKNALDLFIEENCYQTDGAMVVFKDFYERFEKSLLDPAEFGVWSKKTLSAKLPVNCPVGPISSSANYHIGNLAWKKNENGEYLPPPPVRPRIIRAEYKLVEEDTWQPSKMS